MYKPCRPVYIYILFIHTIKQIYIYICAFVDFTPQHLDFVTSSFKKFLFHIKAPPRWTSFAGWYLCESRGGARFYWMFHGACGMRNGWSPRAPWTRK